MKLTITLTTDNAAFEDDPGEVSRILRELADKLYGNSQAAGWSMKLRDINGNRVGEAWISNPDAPMTEAEAWHAMTGE